MNVFELFPRCFGFEYREEGENKNSPHVNKIAWIGGIALSSFALATWQVIKRKPWTAFLIVVGGMCLEIALMILHPFRRIEPSLLLDPKTSPSKLSDPAQSQDQQKDKTDEVAHESPIDLDTELTIKEEVQKLTDTKDEFILEAESVSSSPLSPLIDPFTSVIEHLERCYPVQAIGDVEMRNKQEGGLKGLALGDAIGLFTEFTTKEEAKKMMKGEPIEMGPHYPKGFHKGPNWHHISRFIKNGWTDDTDQALSLLRALYLHLKNVDKEGKPNSSFDLLFALELIKWKSNGLKSEGLFQGRSKPYCMGLGALVASVLKQSTFLTNPKQTAKQVWGKEPEKALQNRPAANGAIMRTAPIGFIFYRSLKDVVDYTTEACKVTHADPRCIASCVALTLAIAVCLRGYGRDVIFQVAEEGGLAVLRKELEDVAEKNLLSNQESEKIDNLYEKTAEDFKAHLHGNWETLDLAEGYKSKEKINKIGYTFKCMGAAFYALHLADQYQKEMTNDIYRTIIEEIAGEGGDADTNGAAAGGLIGAFLGFKGQFPLNWTTNLADAGVIEQAVEHIAELSQIHQQQIV